jgi:hypothetical protein
MCMGYQTCVWGKGHRDVWSTALDLRATLWWCLVSVTRYNIAHVGRHSPQNYSPMFTQLFRRRLFVISAFKQRHTAIRPKRYTSISHWGLCLKQWGYQVLANETYIAARKRVPVSGKYNPSGARKKLTWFCDAP